MDRRDQNLGAKRRAGSEALNVNRKRAKGGVVDRAARHMQNWTMVKVDSTRLAQLCRQHGVKRLRIFGSTARGEERPDSDVDLIADFESPTGFFGLIRFEEALAAFFGRPVDLVTEPGLSPYMRDSILSSAAVLFDGAA